ncbi:hypothetical protein LSAT2_025726, partial [Lamellibrachia satsuma]
MKPTRLSPSTGIQLLPRRTLIYIGQSQSKSAARPIVAGAIEETDWPKNSMSCISITIGLQHLVPNWRMRLFEVDLRRRTRLMGDVHGGWATYTADERRSNNLGGSDCNVCFKFVLKEPS